MPLVPPRASIAGARPIGTRPGFGAAPPAVPPPARSAATPPPLMTPPPAAPPPSSSAPGYPYPAGTSTDRRTHAPTFNPWAGSPGYPPPGYPPPSYPPPSYPPASYPYPAGASVDRRTHAPGIDPWAAGYPVPVDPAWGYDGDAGWYDAPPFDPSYGPAFDLWSGLFGAYLGTRNAAVSATGETYPETTAGDVRRTALAFSRELCLPRYDFADLAATRAAWRDALTRVHALCASLPWDAPYPENERFWLSDSLALAQRLAAVDARRNGIVESAQGSLLVAGDRSDPLTTWQDLRAFFLARRLNRSDDRGWRYPETTVGDQRNVVGVLDEDLRDTIAPLSTGSPVLGFVLRYARRWRPIADEVKERARRENLDQTADDNARFWREARRLAVGLSAARSVGRDRGVLGALTDEVAS